LELKNIKKSEINSFVAEVFYDEMLWILGENKNKKFWIKKRGMNSRAYSQDIIDVSNYNYVINDEIKEAVFIHLSRNSIYHQLPEFFFHPLVISNPSMSNAEVVDSIRKNRKIEEDNIFFFVPFDTLLFEAKLALTNRYTNIYTNETSKKALFTIAKKLIGKDIPLTNSQYYTLFLNLCNSEELKENLPELELLLKSIIVEHDIELKYVAHKTNNSPFKSLGYGILGYDFGMQGTTICEFEDVAATIIINKKIEYKTIKKYMEIIKMVLEYFIFSNREIIINFQTKSDMSIVLGENHLGFNTVLTNLKK